MAFSLINPLYPRPHIAKGTSTAASGFMLTVSSSSTATSFTASSFDADCEFIFFDIQDNNVLITFDGTSGVSGTTGHLFQAGTNYTWQKATATQAKFIALTAAGTAHIYASQFSM